MALMSFFNYNKLHRIAFIVLLISYISLAVVLAIPTSTGIKRWIPLGMFNIQPSEIAKFAIILFFAHWSSKYYNKMQFARYSVLPGIIVFSTTAILLFLEPHYSGIVILGILTVLMLYIGGMKTKYLVIGVLILGAVVILLALTGQLSYAMSRLDGWGQALEIPRKKCGRPHGKPEIRCMQSAQAGFGDWVLDSPDRSICTCPNLRMTLSLQSLWKSSDLSEQQLYC